MLPRFYVPTLTREAVEATLPADEAGHLTRVLRLTVGAPLRVFDGRGLERLARVGRADRAGVLLEVGEPIDAAPEPRIAVTLGQALLKGDKFDAVIRDAVMLGVSRVRPMVTARTDVPARAARDGGRLDRWRRVAVSSVKQCGRAVVPVVEAAADLPGVLAVDSSVLRLLLAEPALGVPSLALRDLGPALAGASSVLLLVGPEGGWTRDEADAACAQGCRVVGLGGRTLRADAAPLVALSVIMHRLGDI